MISPNFISIPVTFIPLSQNQLEVQLIDTLASDMGYYMERATQYLHVVVSLLVFFAKTGDGVVKAYMAKVPTTRGKFGPNGGSFEGSIF